MLQKIICQRTTLLRAQIFKRGHGKRQITLPKLTQAVIAGACRGGIAQISSERFRLPMRGEAVQRWTATAALAFFTMTGGTAKLAIEPFAFRMVWLHEEQA